MAIRSAAGLRRESPSSGQVVFDLRENKINDEPKGLKWQLQDCDRTTSEMRGLSPKIILGDSRRSENAQTHINRHTIPNMKFKLKLLQIMCHVLGFTKDKAQSVLQKRIKVLRKLSSLTIGTRSSP
jgi:hypothetical protein